MLGIFSNPVLQRSVLVTFQFVEIDYGQVSALVEILDAGAGIHDCDHSLGTVGKGVHTHGDLPNGHRLSSAPEDIKHALDSPMLGLTQTVDTLIDILKRNFMPPDRQTKSIEVLQFIERLQVVP